MGLFRRNKNDSNKGILKDSSTNANNANTIGDYGERRVVYGFGSNLSNSEIINFYNDCGVLQLVLNKRCEALIKGNLICCDLNGKAINPTSGFKNAIKFLSKINGFQNFNQFIQNIEMFKSLFGAAYIYKLKSTGFGLSGLIVIPNTCINVFYKQSGNFLFDQNIIESLTITIYGTTYLFNLEEIKEYFEIIQDSNISISQNSPFQPFSKLNGIRDNIENLILSTRTRLSITQDRGATTVVSPENTNDPAAVATQMLSSGGDFQKIMQSSYSGFGTLKNQWHTFFSKIPVKVSSIGKTADELGLINADNEDTKKIFLAFSCPPVLASVFDTQKYNNYKEAKTEFYEDGIIPSSKIIASFLDKIFQSNKEGWMFYFDYSHLSCMQNSEKDKASAMMITVNALKTALESGIIEMEQAKRVINDFIE